MRHRVYGRHLGRDKNERTTLFKGLVRDLILHESLKTTESKAKAIKGLVDKVITAGKKNTPASKRVLQSLLTSEEAEKKIFSILSPRFSSRQSGFAKVVRLGRRSGDGAMMVKMSLINPDQINPDQIGIKDEVEEKEPEKEIQDQGLDIKETNIEETEKQVVKAKSKRIKKEAK